MIDREGQTTKLSVVIKVPDFVDGDNIIPKLLKKGKVAYVNFLKVLL